jgi:hypothetical protein
MKLLLITIITLCTLGSRSQTGPGDSAKSRLPAGDTAVYTRFEIGPVFVGGEGAWKRFLSRYLRSPNESDAEKMVIVRFIVETDGNTSHITVLTAPSGDAYSDEAIRVIKKSNGFWVAAVDQGRHVRAFKTVSIPF